MGHAILGARWRNTLVGSDSAWDVFPKIRGDFPFGVELLLLGVLVIGVIRVLGWLITVGEPGDGGSR